MHEYPEMLSLDGNQITFVDFDEDRKFWQPGKTGRHQIISGRVHKAAVINLFRPVQLGIPGLDRFLVIFSFIPLMYHLCRKNKFDLVLLYAIPTFGIQTILLAKLFKTPVIFRALDVSHKLRKTPFEVLIKKIERFVYKHADLISANNSTMAEYCMNLGERTSNSVVHYPPLDLHHFDNVNITTKLRNNLSIIETDKVILYLGSFFYFSGLINVINEFSKISTETDQIKLLIIGGGEQDKALRKLVKDLNLTSKVIFTGYIAYQDLPQYLHLADVAINPLESNLVTNTALPNKVLQYLASDLPVVSINLKGLKSIFNINPAITWCDTPEEVIQEAFKLVVESNLAQLSESSKSELKSILKQFEPEIALKSLEQSIKQIARIN